MVSKPPAPPAPTPVADAPRLSDAERLRQRQAFTRASVGLLDSTIFAGSKSSKQQDAVETRKKTLGSFGGV